jgi:hypothetical protein
MSNPEIVALRLMVDALTARVVVLENELGLMRAELSGPRVTEVFPEPAAAPSKQSPPRKPVAKASGKKSNFEDDGKLYFVPDYTEKSYAIFGKTAYHLIEPVAKGFRMLYTEKMVFGPGATGFQAMGPAFVAAVKADVLKRKLRLDVIELTRAEMTERFGALEAN